MTDTYKQDKHCIEMSHQPHQNGIFCQSLPTVGRIDNEYLGRTAPKDPTMIPAIGLSRLTYGFTCPADIAPEQSPLFAQLPKRIGPDGLLRASPQDEVFGWGIHVEIGFGKTAIFFLCAIVALFSLLFGLVWSVKRGDIQGAFAVSGYAIAVGTSYVCGSHHDQVD